MNTPLLNPRGKNALLYFESWVFTRPNIVLRDHNTISHNSTHGQSISRMVSPSPYSWAKIRTILKFVEAKISIIW